MPALALARAVCTLALVAAAPAPGRVPKVYNALITSNQNLEPSKAYPVYQPVLQDPLFYPPFFYSAPEYPNIFADTSQYPSPLLPRGPPGPPPPQGPPGPPRPIRPAEDSRPDPEAKPAAAEPPPAAADGDRGSDNQGPPPPPRTESPIPLNKFGLPPQVLPLGRDPFYPNYSSYYPGYRFYSPYDPFGYNPYLSFPPVASVPNSVGQQPVSPAPSGSSPPPGPPSPAAPPAPASDEAPAPTPPPEPDNLNVLNFAAKDPAIPNVPPPPLPQGGIKAEDTE